MTLPLFIVFEGIDGSGKTTIQELLYNYYMKLGLPAVRNTEPSSGEWGRQIRSFLKGRIKASPEEQLELFLLDREDDVKRNIIPFLNEKKIILMDRYYYSNAAYQGAMGVSYERILSENRVRNFPEPDRVYLIDIDPEEALSRISRGKRGALEIFEKKQFLEKVREIYNNLKDKRFVIIDGLQTPEEILKKIIEDIEINFG